MNNKCDLNSTNNDLITLMLETNKNYQVKGPFLHQLRL